MDDSTLIQVSSREAFWQSEMGGWSTSIPHSDDWSDMTTISTFQGYETSWSWDVWGSFSGEEDG